MNLWYNEFGDYMDSKLKQLRLKKEYTSLQMAEQLGISKAFYSQLENGNRRLSYDLAVRIAKILKTKPDKLFYEEYINNLRI